MSTIIIITPPPPPPAPPKTTQRVASEVNSAIDQAIKIIGKKYDSEQARVMLFAIGRQESRFEHRKQVGGPARGFWQFEKGGGVKGVLTHKASAAAAKKLCEALDVEPTADAVYAALAENDVLAAGFARLLLWTDAAPLPPCKAGAAQDAWAYYKRNWRPGKPHRQTWDRFWMEAIA